MERIAGEVEKMIDVLDDSQDRLEEMAYELLNDVDMVKNYNEEIFRLIHLLELAETPNERKEVFQQLKNYTVEASSAIETLVNFVHKNEEISSKQHQHIEEVRQAFDFLQCFIVDRKR